VTGLVGTERRRIGRWLAPRSAEAIFLPPPPGGKPRGGSPILLKLGLPGEAQ
jgi:hypothetical protein